MFHFALLPHEVHLVVQVPAANSLSKAMSGLNLAYTWYYRRKYQYSGHLWQGRYRSTHIEREVDLLTAGRYVELRPVVAKLAAEPGEYRWTSFHVYSRGQMNPLVTENPFFRALGTSVSERKARYDRFVQSHIRIDPAPPDALRDGFSIAPRRIGRPRKLPIHLWVLPAVISIEMLSTRNLSVDSISLL
jgi:putative transposase